ncbi:MAG: hypothetical protein ACOX3C_01080 [Bacilli bacterium]|jgi:hypothetical protein
MRKVDLEVKHDDLVTVRKEMYDRIMQNKAFVNLLKEQGATPETITNNVGALNDYLDAYLSVEDCKKAGHCLNNDKYHALHLEINAPFVSLERQMCPVYFKSQEVLMRFVVKDFPENYIDLKIEDLPRRRGFAAYMRELMSLLRGDNFLVYASGLSGIGKLQTAVSFVMRMLEEDKDKRAGVVDFPAFIREYASDYYGNKAVIDSHIDQYVSLDILIINGFGNEENNKLIRESIVFPLISARIQQKKPTILLAEITIDELSNLYDFTNRDVRARQIINLIKANIVEEIYLQGTKL